MRHKQHKQAPDSMRIWTWRPGVAVTFDVPAALPLRMRRVHRTRSSRMRAERRSLERALDRWLNEGGRDVCGDDVVVGVPPC